MRAFKKHISLLLLLIFGWLLMPASLLHDAFADHQDTDDSECYLHHRSMGVHIEKEHTHCGIFNTNTPLYDSPKVTALVKVVFVFLSVLHSRIEASYHHLRPVALPSRAPPIA